MAYPIGPIEKGVPLPVGIVLTLSRIDIVYVSAVFMALSATEGTPIAVFRLSRV
ncbi:hypothetical protein NDK43_22900 [Neobacillus pocheonensis]|uniref:Uncharacterized protein n=1 Tax=Neobacillus pocheonensis TaxID=363869 RepID=A0ABT0WED0_9BACI|nr:hypothetical protein [Neobacillus pocheonensis]